MRVERLSERAVILRDLLLEPFELAKSLNAHPLPDLKEAVASYETVGLYFSEPILETDALVDRLGAALAAASSATQPRQLTIPVCYELGEDLQAASSSLRMTPEELIGIHLDTEYRCYAVGFSPGFAYLGYLDDRIASLPRLPSPRRRVDAGSVGITGRQTAVYPAATPGGWNLIGRCPLELVNVEENYFPIEAGDLIRFSRIDEAEFSRRRGERL